MKDVKSDAYFLFLKKLRKEPKDVNKTQYWSP